jgi:hypothetical protein
MARRASSKTPLLLIFVSLLLVFIGVGGGYYLYHSFSDPFRTLQPMDVSGYLDNANSLRGNVYKVRGTVQSSLAWSPGGGRLFSIEVGTGNGGEILPVLVPASFNAINIQKGQRYYFKVEIGRDGIILVQDLTKS